MDISRVLEHSEREVISIYSEEIQKLRKKSQEPPRVDVTNEKPQLLENVQQLGDFLKTDPLETLMFVAIYSVQIIRGCSVDCRDVARFIDITNMDFLLLKSSVEGLFQKGLICEAGRRSADEYKVNSKVERALLENKPFKVMRIPKIDRYQFCQNISSFIQDRSETNIDTEALFDSVSKEEKQQKHLPLVKAIKKLLPEVEDRTLFYEICDDFVGSPRFSGLECTLKDMYESTRDMMRVAKSIMNKENALIVSDLVELRPTGGAV